MGFYDDTRSDPVKDRATRANFDIVGMRATAEDGKAFPPAPNRETACR